MKEKVNVKINEQKYQVAEEVLGSELKSLAGLSVDVRLVIKVDNAADIEIENTKYYELENGMKLVSDDMDDNVKVLIDNKHYVVNRYMTGAELLLKVDASPEEYKIIKESKELADEEYRLDVKYEINKNDVFFTILRKLMNGGSTFGIA